MEHGENKAQLGRNRIQLQLGTLSKTLRGKTLHCLGFQAVRLWRIRSQFPALLATSCTNLDKFPLRLHQECLPGTFLSHVTTISGQELVHSPAPVPRPSEPVGRRSYTNLTALASLLFPCSETQRRTARTDPLEPVATIVFMQLHFSCYA